MTRGPVGGFRTKIGVESDHIREAPHALSTPRSVPFMKSRLAGAFLSPVAGRSSERIPAFGRGRVCEAPGCGTRLSIYNPALYCSLHEAARLLRPRR